MIGSWRRLFVETQPCFLQLQFVVEVEEKTTFFYPFIYLLDIAKVNFSVIILNSGFRILGLPLIERNEKKLFLSSE